MPNTDHFFKVAILVQAFLLLMVPQPLRRCLDEESIEYLSTEFISRKLKRSQADALIKVRWRDGTIRYILLLFEHKSQSDPGVLLQLLRYQVQVIEWLERQGLPMYPIVCIVVYTGQKPWNVRQTFQDPAGANIEAQAGLGGLLNFSYQLVSLRDIPDEALTGNGEASLYALTMKYAYSRQIPEKLPWILREIRGLKEAEWTRAVETAIEYLSEFTQLKLPQVQRAIQQSAQDPAWEKAVMPTIADTFRKQGFKLGIKQGVERGVKQGIQQGVKQGVQQGAVEGRVSFLLDSVASGDLSVDAALGWLDRDLADGKIDAAAAKAAKAKLPKAPKPSKVSARVKK